MPSVSCYSDYTIATKWQAGQGWHSRSRLWSEPASFFHPMTQCEAPAKRLNEWFWDLGVGQPKPFVTGHQPRMEYSVGG